MIIISHGPAARRPSTRGIAGSGERGGTPIRQPLWLDERTALPYQNNSLMIACLIFLTQVFRAPDRTVSTAGRDRPAPWNPRSGFEGEGANQGDVSRPERSGGRVTATEKRLIARGRLSPTKEVTGGRRTTLAQESEASAGFRGRGADCATAREPGRPREARSLRERAKNRKPEGQGSQREASVCRRPGAPNRSGRAERPRVYAAAEPAATPEDRQSERSEVCRDRVKEKYKMPEGRACRRAAVVRPAPEAGREPLSGADGRGCQAAGGAERSPNPTDDGSREGGRGRTARQAVHQAGRERRRGATPATATPPPSPQIP